MKLMPYGSQVIVRRSDKEEKSPGGILLPDTAKEKPRRGEVLAVGPGRYDAYGTLVPMRVRIGRIVVFGSYQGIEVDVEGEKLLVIEEEHILGYLEGDEYR